MLWATVMVLWATVMDAMGCFGPLLWAAMCAMVHCYGYYGLLWATVTDVMGYYGPHLWAAVCAMGHCYGPVVWVL